MGEKVAYAELERIFTLLLHAVDKSSTLQMQKTI